MTPRTEKEALDQCQRLWEELARTGGDIDEKYRSVERVLGYRPMHACPACEWDESAQMGLICSACPIKAWRRTDKYAAPNACCADDSPYERWANASSVRYRKQFAQQILKLIEESKDEEVSRGP